MAFTERERQILVGVDLEAQTADEGALQAFADACSEGGGGGGLPDVSGADNGDVLTVVEGAWAKAAPPSVTPTALTGTLDIATGAITLAMTAAELFAAATANGRFVATITAGEAEVTVAVGLTAQYDGTSNYDFAMLGATGPIFVSGHLAANDAVVLSPVTT